MILKMEIKLYAEWTCIPSKSVTVNSEPNITKRISKITPSMKQTSKKTQQNTTKTPSVSAQL